MVYHLTDRLNRILIETAGLVRPLPYSVPDLES